jgi:PAS domain S-box-containing protein
MNSGSSLATAMMIAPEAGRPPEALLGPWTDATAPVYCRDLTGRVLAANSAFMRKFGRTTTELPGLTAQSLINSDDMPMYHSAAAELARSPHQAARSHRWLTPQGWRWMSWEESTLFNSEGTAIAVRAIGHDITRQRLSEELYLKLSRAVEQSPVSVVITDADGRVQYVNPKFTQISGYTLEEIVEGNLPILREGHPSEESYQEFWAAVRAGRDWEGELTHQRPGGATVWESVQVSCLRGPMGEITNLLCLREDITIRRRLEEQLRQAQKMESLGTLAGGIAHDFNNLLAVINGYTELSQMKSSEDPVLQKNLREIKRATQRATGLVRQILTFSRKAEADFTSLDLNQLVRDLVALLSETFPRPITFNLALMEALPPLLADQNQLQQIVLNLCVNARDAMPTGGTISLTTSVVPGRELTHLGAAGDRTYACLQTGDTGQGMTPEVRARIFEPFFTTKSEKGTGLGLAVVYGIVASHHGFIEVDSTLNVGSTFKIYLPLSGATLQVPAAPQPNHFPGGQESLLVVDDEGPLRNLLKVAFVRKGYRVVSASDGLEAIDLINDPACTIDAVLLDFNMPGATGLQVMKAISVRRPDLKVMVLSGHLTPQIRAEFEQLGQKDFVNKPYTLDELGRRLRALLDAR